MLTPIASFRDLEEAERAKARLEAAGLLCFVTHAGLSRVSRSFPQTGSRSQLLVRGADHERARMLLDSGPDLEPPRRGFADTLYGPGAQACPRCGSSEVRSQGYSNLSIAVALLLLSLMLRLPFLVIAIGIPAIFLRRRAQRCFDCEHRWSLAR